LYHSAGLLVWKTMAGGAAKREIEVKLRLRSPEQARRLLYKAGFRVSRRRRHEDNLVFDTPDRGMRAKGLLLRLRRSGRDATLTYKGPAAAGTYKSRQEFETAVGDPDVLETMIVVLGFEIVFRYEKFRTEYGCPDRRGVVTLDETPIGTFLELEGEPNWIDHVARRLGFSKLAYITDSYAGLYYSERKPAEGSPVAMLFPRRGPKRPPPPIPLMRVSE
jgi:adenylate cyclase, class 2